MLYATFGQAQSQVKQLFGISICIIEAISGKY